MTEIENQTLNLLKILIENKDKIFESINEAKEKLIPIVNITNILGCATDEVKNSSLLHNLLKVKFKYENKEINFAKDFSECIIKEKLKNDSVDINSTAEAFNEFYASNETWRRIDLLIKSDNFEIIIENKIWAGDQPKQLQDYYENRVKDNDKIKDNIFIIYLTVYGNKPSEFSINKKLLEELENENKICYLSHDDIAEWIEKYILNKYQFLKEKEFQSIYSALIQIRDNEKFISKKTEENKMEINEIKKFFEDNKYFENLLNEDEPVKDNFDKLNKFYELLENAQIVILDKKVELVSDDINYSLKVIEFIKSYQSNKGEDYMKGAYFYSGVVNYVGYSLNINIPIENTNCAIYLQQHVIYPYPLCVSVYCNNNYITNKLIEEPIKNEIGKILDEKGNSDKYIGDSRERNYIYSLYIDTEKYKPEEIGQKIIDLYDFLKEKIAQ